MDNNPSTLMLALPALLLLAIIPAFLLAARQAKKTRGQVELEKFNAELEKKREQKLERRKGKRRDTKAPSS